MTVSMVTTRLSSVITGCGGKETTCSRRSISGLHPVDERHDEREPGVEGAAGSGRAARRSPARACGTIRIAARRA